VHNVTSWAFVAILIKLHVAHPVVPATKCALQPIMETKPVATKIVHVAHPVVSTVKHVKIINVLTRIGSNYFTKKDISLLI
jgi:hypothetical protein